MVIGLTHIIYSTKALSPLFLTTHKETSLSPFLQSFQTLNLPGSALGIKKNFFNTQLEFILPKISTSLSLLFLSPLHYIFTTRSTKNHYSGSLFIPQNSAIIAFLVLKSFPNHLYTPRSTHCLSWSPSQHPVYTWKTEFIALYCNLFHSLTRL